MPDDIPPETIETRTPEPSVRPARHPWWRRHWLILALLVVIAVPGALFALWATITLHWSYSSGERAGYIQKFSQKGWLCKTWEGEIAVNPIPGSMPTIFAFSVRSDSIAQQIRQLMSDKVVLSYEQHKGVPTGCFGDTEYFVVGVKRVQ